jgi:hypothetical protein
VNEIALSPELRIPGRFPVIPTGSYLKPSQAFYIDLDRAMSEDGKELSGDLYGIDWNLANINLYRQHLKKSGLCEGLVFPGTRRYSEAKLVSKQGYKDVSELVKRFGLPEEEVKKLIVSGIKLHSSMIFYGKREIVNTLVVQPKTDTVGKKGGYSDQVREISEIPSSGKNVYVVDEPILVKTGGSYRWLLDKENPVSEVIEIEWTDIVSSPRIISFKYFTKNLRALGLPNHSRLKLDFRPTDVDNLRALIRDDTTVKQSANLWYSPLHSDKDAGFRFGRIVE